MLQVNNTILEKKSKTKTKEKITFSSALLSVAIAIVMILILVNPTRYAISVTNGLKLFCTAVLPGLLPFMFLTKILTNLNIIAKLTKPIEKPMRKLFGLGAESFYVLVMSMISGYPIGAKITSDLYMQGKISKQEVTPTAIIGSTSGPIFVIGAVGGTMLNSPKLGAIIYISNTLSVILVSIILHFFSIKKRKHSTFKTEHEIIATADTKTNINTNNKNILASATTETVSGLLAVGFYVAMFSLIIDLLTDLKIIEILSYPLKVLFAKLQINSDFALGIMSGIIEMTNGAKALSNYISPLSISFISMIIAFGGFSIIMQSLSFLSKTPIKTWSFIFAKFLQAILSFIICLGLTTLII